MEIGERLKEAREAKNISLDRLQETTKIQKRYLIAIEQGNFQILPGKFYARAFIKEYALAVGLDPNELLEGYLDEAPSTEGQNTGQYSRMQRSRRGDSASKSPAILSVIPTFIVVLLVIGIIFVAYTLLNQKANSNDNFDPVDPQDKDEVIHKNPKPATDDDSSNDEEEPEEIDEDIVDEIEPDVVESELLLVQIGTGNKPESTFELINSDDVVKIRFEPTGTTWLDIKDSDLQNAFYSGNTVPNEPIELEITGEDRFRINIGSAPNLPAIFINDIKFEYPVDANRFVTQRFWINVTKASE